MSKQTPYRRLEEEMAIWRPYIEAAFAASVLANRALLSHVPSKIVFSGGTMKDPHITIPSGKAALTPAAEKATGKNLPSPINEEQAKPVSPTRALGQSPRRSFSE